MILMPLLFTIFIHQIKQYIEEEDIKALMAPIMLPKIYSSLCYY